MAEKWRRHAASNIRKGRAGFFSLPVALVLLVSSVAAQEGPARDAAQEQYIVYIQTREGRVSVAVDGMTVYWSDQHLWNHQFNLTAWLDTEPHTVSFKASMAQGDTSSCRVEIRKAPAGDPSAATVVAEKTVRGRELKEKGWVPILSLDVALPAGSVRPLWADPAQADLGSVSRRKSSDLLKEIQDALRTCDHDSLMTLIAPAVTNQALMEGADLELLERVTRDRLGEGCVRGIRVAETMDAYYKALGEDVMAPMDFERLKYTFTVDESRNDKRGTLFKPKAPINYRTRDGKGYEAQVYLSYTDEQRNRRFVSRFEFMRDF